jgi:DNA-binding XRE family transcriptional regulator
MLTANSSNDVCSTTRELAGGTWMQLHLAVTPSRRLCASLAFVFKFIGLRHQHADADTQTFTQSQQRLEGRVVGASRQATEPLLIQTRAPVHGVLVNLGVLGYQHFDRLAERRVRCRTRRDFSLRWHQREVYSAACAKVRAYIAYHACRQSSASQFGGFPVSDHNQQTANLRRLGEAFQQIRTEQGRELDELAASSGVEPERIRALERGELDPDLDMMLALAHALDRRPSAFVLRAEAIAEEHVRED